MHKRATTSGLNTVKAASFSRMAGLATRKTSPLPTIEPLQRRCEAKVTSMAPAAAFASIGTVLAKSWANETTHGRLQTVPDCNIGL